MPAESVSELTGKRSFFEAEGISKRFGGKKGPPVTALDAVSFAVRAGGVTALVGPDGAGKTTLLRIIAGLLSADSGSLRLNGEPLRDKDEAARESIGYMPQKFGLYEDLTVQENLDLYADLRGLAGELREERYRELLRMCAMEPFRQRLAGKLSGGMKQKLGLICTLVSPPRLLLLDEPTVGVDPLSRRELWQIIQTLTGSSGMSVVVSTSYLDEAARCDEIVLLFQGKTLARDTPEAVRSLAEGMSFIIHPAKEDTPRSLQARLLGAPGVIDAVPQGGAVRLVHGELDDGQREQLLARLRGAIPQPAPPRLEDSFMFLLRGREERPTDAPGDGVHDGHGERGATPPSGEAVPATVASGIVPGGAEEAEAPVIRTEHVSRLFGDFIAVNNVSFSVRRGEVFGLLGPNGAGKTTTFRMLCGLLPPSKGSLFVAGVNVREARKEARRRIGYVAQKFSLYGPLSVRENLEFFAGAYGLKGAERDSRIREVTVDFSLEHHLDTPADALPGGYRQRLSMAVGLLHRPAILFLDEPTSGADPLARRDFWKRISRLADLGVTIVVTTHFMEEAEYCDRVLIQDSGLMLALDTPAGIRARAGDGSGDSGDPDARASMEDAFIAIVEEARNNNGEKAA